MAKISFTNKLNPNFILYNLVFGSNPLPNVDAKNLLACMKVYKVPIEEKQIEEKLNEWYKEGLLTVREDGSYIIA